MRTYRDSSMALQPMGDLLDDCAEEEEQEEQEEQEEEQERPLLSDEDFTTQEQDPAQGGLY